MARGMFVTVLGRLANADMSVYKQSSFADVKSDAYYMGYVEWANKNSIVYGTGNGNFAPEQSITREQMAGIINGKNGNLFDPQDTATRAEVSAVLRRFIELAIY